MIRSLCATISQQKLPKLFQSSIDGFFFFFARVRGRGCVHQWPTQSNLKSQVDYSLVHKLGWAPFLSLGWVSSCWQNFQHTTNLTHATFFKLCIWFIFMNFKTYFNFVNLIYFGILTLNLDELGMLCSIV